MLVYSLPSDPISDDEDIIIPGRYLIFLDGHIAHLSHVLRDDDNPRVGVHSLVSSAIIRKQSGKPDTLKKLADDFNPKKGHFKRIHLGNAVAMSNSLEAAVIVRNAIKDFRSQICPTKETKNLLGKTRAFLKKKDPAGVDCLDVDMRLNHDE